MNNKVCKKCGIGKSLDQFHKDASRIDGHDCRCKKCRLDGLRKWNKDNPRVSRSHKIKFKYGITLQEFETLVQSQEGKCACCGDPFLESKHTHIDHSHETGEVRGILCNFCNTGLGQFRDSISRLQKAIEYLQKNS